MTPLYDTSIDWSKPPIPPDWEGLKAKQDKQLSDALKFSDAKIEPVVLKSLAISGSSSRAPAAKLPYVFASRVMSAPAR